MYKMMQIIWLKISHELFNEASRILWGKLCQWLNFAFEYEIL